MNTLDELRAGRLAGATRIKMAAGLSDFPREFFALSDTLEYLDLSGNCLSSLPNDFYRLKKLRILFLSNNNFEVFPEVLARCPELSMVGFKANNIRCVPENSFPAKIRWLILTDNQIESLPRSIGSNVYLQKVMLAGNRLRALPEEMASCANIELLRISANQLEALPTWLLELPRLSWLAYAGNPCTQGTPVEDSVSDIHWDELTIHHRLGEGASGIIYQARVNGTVDVAFKEFKGCVTSDGRPADELSATIAAGHHQSLVTVLGKLTGHPQQKSGLLLALIDSAFSNLAKPPSLESCTRDVYAEERTFNLHEVLTIVKAIAAAAMHLHERGIMHGDLYAHNILVNSAADCLLGDFGAATRYDTGAPAITPALQRIEVRAFGCLLEELLQRLVVEEPASFAAIITQLTTLQQRCHDPNVLKRPDFSEINRTLESIAGFG